MAPSYLKIKKIDRHTLWFNQYIYKVAVTDSNLFLLRHCKNLDDYIHNVKEYGDSGNLYAYGPRFEKNKPVNKDLINIMLSLLNDKDIRSRHEGNVVALYSNDFSKFDTLLNTKCSKIMVEEATAMPTGIKYFRREPPSKFRVYLKNNTLPPETGKDILDYLAKTPDVSPNNPLLDELTRSIKYQYNMYFYGDYYFNYI